LFILVFDRGSWNWLRCVLESYLRDEAGFDWNKNVYEGGYIGKGMRFIFEISLSCGQVGELFFRLGDEDRFYF